MDYWDDDYDGYDNGDNYGYYDDDDLWRCPECGTVIRYSHADLCSRRNT
jgi:hypothetical protein